MATFFHLRERAVFVFPSRFETLGITPLEAMSCGMVVICTDDLDRVGMAEYIPDNFKFTLNTTSLLQKINWLIKDVELRRAGEELRLRLEENAGLELFHYELKSMI